MYELLVSCALSVCVIAFFYIMAARHLVRSTLPTSDNIHQAETREITEIMLDLTVVFLIIFMPFILLTCSLLSDVSYLQT
jgi:hypothetical protein